MTVLQLFAASGCESAEFATAEELSNHMGLFLQVSHLPSLCFPRQARKGQPDPSTFCVLEGHVACLSPWQM